MEHPYPAFKVPKVRRNRWLKLALILSLGVAMGMAFCIREKVELQFESFGAGGARFLLRNGSAEPFATPKNDDHWPAAYTRIKTTFGWSEAHPLPIRAKKMGDSSFMLLRGPGPVTVYPGDALHLTVPLPENGLVTRPFQIGIQLRSSNGNEKLIWSEVVTP